MSLETILIQHLEKFPICNLAMLVSISIIIFALVYRAFASHNLQADWLALKFELRETEKEELGTYEGDFTLTDCVSGSDSVDAVRIVRDDSYVITPNEASRQLIREYKNKLAMPVKVLIIAVAILASSLLQYLVSWLIFLM